MKKLFLFCTFFFFISNLSFADKIKSIDIEGNKRIEISTIEEYLSVKLGEEYSDIKNSQIIKSLYSTTLFEDVSVSFKNGKLSVIVKENTLVSEVLFIGNYKI